VDESAPEGEAPDSRQTDGEGWQTPSAGPVLPAVRLCCALALVLPADPGKEGLGGIPGRLLLTRQRQHPCGASGLVGDPTPAAPRKYSNTLLTHPLNQKIRASVGAPTRTGGQPRGACGEGGTTGAADLLSAGHSPHPLAWSQALPSSHARPQAGQAVGAPNVRLVYRPETVRLAQPSP
jgi:hypothetical protein